MGLALGQAAARVSAMRVFPAVAAVVWALVAGGGAGCDSPPSAADLKEWTPQDHDRKDEKERAAQGGQPTPQGSGSKEDGNRAFIESTWRGQCAPCHGLIGRGDGPNGPINKATDLTKEDWQSSMSDAQIAASITTGKGKMPRFDLPPNVVAGIVSRIRAVRGK
jgi:cbb3-type cytochrome c oxidase subunit III